MKLSIMRHGPAEDHAASGRDADRALTHSGRGRVRDVAKALVAGGEAPLAIVSSPLVRAEETAEIVASVLAHAAAASGGPAAPRVEIRPEMAPGGDPLSLIDDLLAQAREHVMVVGHEPTLSTLVERLVGDVLPDGMRKAMVVGVTIAPGASGAPVTATLRFVLDPKTLHFRR